MATSPSLSLLPPLPQAAIRAMLELTTRSLWTRSHYANIAHNIGANCMMAILHLPPMDVRHDGRDLDVVTVPVDEFVSLVRMHLHQ